MSEQSTEQPTPSQASTEPSNTPEPTAPGLDEPMFPLPRMDLEVREGMSDPHD